MYSRIKNRRISAKLKAEEEQAEEEEEEDDSDEDSDDDSDSDDGKNLSSLKHRDRVSSKQVYCSNYRMIIYGVA